MRQPYTLILLLLITPCYVSYGQSTLDIEREIQVTRADSSYFLDDWVVEGSINVFHSDTLLPNRAWDFEDETGSWRFSNPEQWQVPITLTFRYSIIPITLRRRYFERELTEPPDSLMEADTSRSVQITRPAITQQDLFGDSQLDRSGSLRRGIIIGSNQDFSLESGLRFDLSGYITDDVEVLATLTDRSTPIQPDGSTQNLREFDQVFIRLNSPLGTLQMGDVDVRIDNSEFAVIERRLQGADVQAELGTYGSYGGSAAVVRGQFRVQQFQGEDGIQGPYRLTGEEGQAFIIVLAGTERVYIDGVRMERGEENDYIIDYGLGEIHFMNNRIITDVTRITVDFQYMDDEYTRTLTAANGQTHEMLGGRLVFGASVIREADNINLGTQFQLSDNELETVREAGDDPTRATSSGVDSVGYQRDADFILYSRVDTVFQGETYQIYRNIPGDSSGVYQVRFGRVGEGQGSYRRAGRAVNGIVYEWVGPGMGNYEPSRRLPLPVEQNMVAFRTNFKATDYLEIFGEWAGSNFDQNRLSSLDAEDDLDNAYTFGSRISPISTRIGTLRAQVSQRYTGRNFAFFDRTREVEFDRRWNLISNEASRERITEGEAGWEILESTGVEIGAGYIDRDEMSGNRQDLRLMSHEIGLPQVDYFLERIDSRNQLFDESGNWYRQQGNINQDFNLLSGSVTPRFGFESEQRRQKDLASDSLNPESFRFIDFRPGLEYRYDQSLTVSADLSYRQDKRVINNEFIDEAVGITQQYAFSYRPSALFQTSNTVAFRSRIFEEFFQISEQRQDNRGILVRSTTDFRPMQRFIDSHFHYEANTERRPIMQETFIETGAEYGNYVWEDTNGDGVRQIDEFFPEQIPNEGTFLLHLVPSDELFPIIALRTRFRLRLDPDQIYNDHQPDTRLERLFAGMRFDTRIEVNENNRTQNLQDIYLLRINKFRDDSLTLQGRVFMSQDIQFFRDNPIYDARFTVDRSLGQNQQATGVESQFLQNFRMEGGYRFLQKYYIKNEIRFGDRDNLSEFLTSRNYLITYREVRPALEVRIDRDFQAGAGFAVIRREDAFPGDPVRANALNIHTDARVSFGPNLQGFMRIERRSFRLDGESSSLGLYELTDGAGEGNTWSWSLQTNYRISDFIRATLNYDGRTITDRPLIHTMRFEISAAF
ncbi:MAG: hypothetical protein WD267_02675 [Balneolales bacterium]